MPSWSAELARPMRALTLFVALVTCGPGCAHAQPSASPAAAFAAFEAAGLRVGEIRVRTENIFDPGDEHEDAGFYRLANRLHMRTRPEVIRQALLFEPGDPVSVRAIEETERLLRAERYLYDVKFHVAAVHDGVVDIDVVTRDTWTLQLGASASRSGGENAHGFELTDANLLGSGATASLAYSRTVDRSGVALGIDQRRAFGTRADLSFSHADNSDGRRDAASVIRPFHALDGRWAAGVMASRDDRVDTTHRAGEAVGRYRHRQRLGEVFAGWSRGLVDGWVNRYSVGLALQDDAFAPQPGDAAPPPMPADRRARVPFVRWASIEDRYGREMNRTLIGRPEFFALGLGTSLQLGRASRALGSSDTAWHYDATISRGFEPGVGRTLTVAARWRGERVDGLHRRRSELQLGYFHPLGPRRLFYASASMQTLENPIVNEELVLGGEEGLRGYPLRYQSGTRRALLTLEQRFFTDVYLWRLFRIGGAAFVDVGRAWGAGWNDETRARWLADVGGGMRIVSSRSSSGKVLHIDLAMPVHAPAGVSRLQFLVKTRASF